MEEDWLKLKEKAHERRELLERDKLTTLINQNCLDEMVT